MRIMVEALARVDEDRQTLERKANRLDDMLVSRQKLVACPQRPPEGPQSDVRCFKHPDDLIERWVDLLELHKQMVETMDRAYHLIATEDIPREDSPRDEPSGYAGPDQGEGLARPLQKRVGVPKRRRKLPTESGVELFPRSGFEAKPGGVSGPDGMAR